MLNSDVEVEISERLAAALLATLDYDLPTERVVRIATDARSIMKELNCSAAFAFAEAVDSELYGDPKYCYPEPIGFLSPRK